MRLAATSGILGAALLAGGQPAQVCVVQPEIERVEELASKLAAAQARIVELEAKLAELSKAASPSPQPAATVEASATSPPVAVEINWRADLATARAEAASSGRPLLVYVWQDGCAPCVRTEQMQSVPNIVKWHNNAFIPVKLHARQAAGLGVRSTPTTLVFQGEREVARFAAPTTPVGYAKLLDWCWRTTGGGQ